MKKLSRKIILATLGVLCGVCCAFGGVAAFSQETAVSVAAEETNSVNTNLSFQSIHAGFNNDANGFFIAQFNTEAWEQAAVPTSYTGITYNGKDISDLATVKFYLTSSLWFSYGSNKAKLVADYNGYSHPTIAIADGATVVYNGETFTFNAVTFYLVDGAWTTTQPEDYAVNTNLSYVTIWSGFTQNNFLVAQFNTDAWAQAAIPTSYTGITYNGKNISTFATVQFFQEHSLWFNYASNTAQLVADYNGYSHPTVAIADGATVVYNGETFTFNAVTFYFVDGAWTTTQPEDYAVNTNLSFQSIHAGFNNDTNGFFIAQFNTEAWAQAAVPTSYTGITYNGKDISDLATVKFYLTSSLWFSYGSNKAKLVADYNGYSHPTIAIADGATVVYNGETFTFNAVTFYLVNEKWTTTKPADYYIGTKLTYSGITWNNIDYSGKSYNDDTTTKALILITYSSLISDASGNAMTTTENVVETYGDTIKLGDTPLKDVEGARIFVFAGNIAVVVPFGDKLVIEDKTDFYGYILEGKTFYLDISQKTELGNRGIWSDTASYTDVTFSALMWDNIDYNGYAQAYCGENGTGTPVKGFCGLLSYSDNLAYNFNDPVNINMATEHFDIGSKLKVNGVAAKDIEGAYISYNAAANHMYFYIPYSGVTAADMYTVTIEAGAHFMKSTLPATTYYFYNGKLNETAVSVVSIYKGTEFVTNKKIGSGVTVTAAWLAEILGNAQYPVSWTIGEDTHYAGDSVAVTAASTVTVTETVTFETMSGASVRLATSGKGIRFGSTLSLADYNALVAKYGEANIKTGTLIAPRYLFDKDGLTIEAYFAQTQGTGAEQKYVNVVNTTADGKLGIYNGNTYAKDGYIRFYGALTDLNESNYYTKFFGVGYVEITVSAGKTVRVYGLTNANKTTRTMYDVAAAAYNDPTASYNYELLKPYLNSVVKLAYTNGNLTVDSSVADGTKGYSVPYSISTDENGNFTITSSVKPTKILINGLVAFSEVSETDGTFSFVLMKDNLSTYGSTMNYGLAEPCYSLWNDGVESKTSTALSTVAGALGVTSYRVWLNGNVATVDNDNSVALNETYFNSVKTHVIDLVNAGVNEICFYCGSAITPYGGQSGAVPDPSKEEDDYATWLKVQYNYYNAFAKEVSGWYTSEAWMAENVKFYFEGVNEPEFQNVIYKRGALSGTTYATEYFSTTELAQVLTDWSYYMTLAVNANLSGKGFVTTPAFTYLSSGSGATSVVNGVYCDTLLAAMYAKINDGVAPTAIDGVEQSNVVSEINSYFTCLNWHPYLPWFKSEHAEMYYGEIVTKSSFLALKKEKKAEMNSNYAQQWAAWNENMYAIAKSGGDTDSPKVFFSEFGICDFSNPTEGNYKLMGIGEELSATVFKALMEKAQSLSFANQLTVMEFRLLDSNNQYGMIDEDGSMKPIMTAYFEIINGDDSIEELEAAVNEYFGSTTSGN